MAEVRVYTGASALARAAAEHFVALSIAAVRAHGQFAVALSGGSTPKTLYSLLATNEFAARLDWTRVHIFWGDERCVPPEHPDSNYRMARQALLDHAPIPAGNIYRIQGEREPAEAADDYERALQAFFTRRQPRFDLILLGMGDDGHTASLFPGTAVIHEQARWVVAYYVEKLRAWRVTLTPVVINAAANVTFVVSGAGKAECLSRVLTGPYQPDVLPAQIVRPADGHLLWLLDVDAAAQLEPEQARGP
jgi:6-phosphogluconolactonase